MAVKQQMKNNDDNSSHVAIEAAKVLGSLPEVIKVVEHDPTCINDTDDRLGWSALHFAAFCGNTTIASFLLDKGADASLPAKANKDVPEGITPLHIACIRCQPEFVHLLLSHGADPCCCDGLGYTPLMLASKAGCVGCVRRLLKDKRARDSLNVQSPKDGATALHQVRRKGMVVVVVM